MPILSALLLAYVSIALLPLGLAVCLGPTSGASVLYELGRSLALTAIPIVVMQPLLTARIQWIDRFAGSGNCLRFHKAMGVFALVALLLHPICLAVGGAGLRLVTSLDFPWFILVGKATLALLTVHVILALYRIPLGLNYMRWKKVHLAAAPLIPAAGLVHSWYAGGDLGISALQGCWIALMILTAAMWLRRRFKGVVRRGLA